MASQQIDKLTNRVAKLTEKLEAAEPNSKQHACITRDLAFANARLTFQRTVAWLEI